MARNELMVAEKPKVAPADSGGVFINLTCADFRRNSDGFWITKRQINIDGPGGVQRLIAAGHQFKRGQMSIFGLDLAVILEAQCPLSAD